MRPSPSKPAKPGFLRSLDGGRRQPPGRRLLSRVAAAVTWTAVAVAVTVDVDAAEPDPWMDAGRGLVLTPLRNVEAMATGGTHTCARLSSGSLVCWGNNAAGQVGDGSGAPMQPLPARVRALGGFVTAFSAGADHTCAVMAGAAYCWGRNASGQLGNGSTFDQGEPVAVTGLGSGIATVSAGAFHSCALTSGGGVKCWGLNSDGQLGDNTLTLRPTPSNVASLSSGVSAITTGSYHSCAMTTGGGVKCWGRNDFGQLGDGTQTPRTSPVDVSGLSSGVRAISAGGLHTCAVLVAGGVRCWGYNQDGQLGDGSTTLRLTPVNVSGFSSGGRLIASGLFHTCAATSTGAVRCWGQNNAGQLGDTTTTMRTTPVNVEGLSSGVAVLASSHHHTCADRPDGQMRCWGGNGSGQLGDYTTTNRTVPVNVLQRDSIFEHGFEAP